MRARGINFAPIDIHLSEAEDFVVVEKNLIRPPLNTLPGISSAIAQSIVKARTDGPFKSHADLMQRASIGASTLSCLQESGIIDIIPTDDQIDMFSLF